MHPYSDLLLGRVDGVLLDNVLAERRRKSMPGITVQPQPVAMSHYVGVLASSNATLRDAVNEVLRTAMRDGSLERIFRKWGVWNDDQPALYNSLLARERVTTGNPLGTRRAVGVANMSRWDATVRYVPSLMRAAGDHADPLLPLDGARGRRWASSSRAGACTAAGRSRAR